MFLNSRSGERSAKTIIVWVHQPPEARTYIERNCYSRAQYFDQAVKGISSTRTTRCGAMITEIAIHLPKAYHDRVYLCMRDFILPKISKPKYKRCVFRLCISWCNRSTPRFLPKTSHDCWIVTSPTGCYRGLRSDGVWLLLRHTHFLRSLAFLQWRGMEC